MQFRRGTLNLRSGCYPSHFQEADGARAARRCFRRAFPEHLTVFNRKTPEFNKAKIGCDVTVTN